MNRQRGFSMIEVLITLVLVSIGILGMVAMQGRAISYTQDSVQRNTAASLADDLMEQMRARRADVLNGLGVPNASSSFYKAAGTAFPAAAASCTTTPTVITQQLGCWAAKAGAALPGASDLLTSDFYICRSAAPGSCSSNNNSGSAIEIRVAWSVTSGECLNPDSSAPADKCYYTLRSEL